MNNYILEWMSELINGLILIFIIINVSNTSCFNTFEWVVTTIGLGFSIFVKFIIRIEQ